MQKNKCVFPSPGVGLDLLLFTFQCINVLSSVMLAYNAGTSQDARSNDVCQLMMAINLDCEHRKFEIQLLLVAPYCYFGANAVRRLYIWTLRQVLLFDLNAEKDGTSFVGRGGLVDGRDSGETCARTAVEGDAEGEGGDFKLRGLTPTLGRGMSSAERNSVVRATN